VSKDWLDADVQPLDKRLRVPNTPEGIRKLKRWIVAFDPAIAVVEATGKWHRQVQRSLHASEIRITVVDPLRARLFAKARGILAKTDRVDARVLALFGLMMSPELRPPAAEAMDELKEIVVARESAVAEQTSLKNQLAAATAAFVKRHLQRRIARLSKDIESLDREILRRVQADQGLSGRYKILTSIPGFGFVTAATLLARLPELGDCDAKQIGLLSGLAPIADDSGDRRGRRIVRGGRPALRRILYLAALSAARVNPQGSAYYKRLIAAGKAHKVALIALARKLVVLANRLVSENRAWQPEVPKPA
jgi:transposase